MRSMRQRAATLAVGVILGVLALAVAPAGLALGAATATTGSAVRPSLPLEIPGTAALNKGGAAGASTMQCTSPGNCTTDGIYATAEIQPYQYHYSVFIDRQVRGKWGRAFELPGMTTLNRGRNASPAGLSCPAPGYCTEVGYYTNATGHALPYTAIEVRGRWHNATRFTVLGSIGAVSCTVPGACTVVGGMPGHTQAFAVNEYNGRWRPARELPGTSVLDFFPKIACTAPGDCTVAGSDKTAGSANPQAFIITEKNGGWGMAMPVPGLAALSSGNQTSLNALSCPAAGNCTAVGSYADTASNNHPFVVDDTAGHWGNAAPLAGMTALNKAGAGELDNLSCAAPGNCTAGGIEGINDGYNARGGGQPLVATETAGRWGSAQLIPGMAKINAGPDGWVDSLSCAAPGDCAAGGTFGIGQNGQKTYSYGAFLVFQVGGKWQTAGYLPGLHALNKGLNAYISSVACPAVGRCSAGGSYADARYRTQALVVSRP
ncbi:MAG: hypothetical protein ACYCO9_20820 [Streptosporangiaceae bacterium]